MVIRNKLKALIIGQVLALLALLLVNISDSEAGFEARPEYRSIIATDPAVNEQFKYLMHESRPRVDEVTEGVYLARGFGQGSAVMVEGDDGVAIFDVGDSYEHGQAMLAAFRKHTDKPIVAIIYSHFHFDHIFGGKAWAEAAVEDVQIIAHESTVRFSEDDVSTVPVATLISQLPFRLDATKASGLRESFSVAITDSGERFTIALRNGVAEVSAAQSSGTADLAMDSESFRLFYIGALPLDEGLASGQIKGNSTKVQTFFRRFDWPGQGV